jgi:uncharacterized protein YndB with AHSA1/START domain
MSNTYSIDIDAPPARVFKWIYDADLNRQWLPNLVEVEVLKKEPQGLGSRFRQVYMENGRRMEMTGTVTGYEQDRYLACEITGPFLLNVDYRLDDLGGRTRVTQHSEIQFRSFAMKLLGALMKPLMRKMAEKNAGASFGKLKQLVEADKS